MSSPSRTPVAVIMAGGAGERFWPYSRQDRPKQLLRLGGGQPFLAETVNRIAPLIPPGRILVVAGDHLRTAILDCLGRDFPPDNVVVEPVPRNTAACLALAGVVTEKRFGPGITMVVLTCDHVIRPAKVFVEQIRLSCRVAEVSGGLVTLGVVPTRPETGFGYIEAGPPREEFGPGVCSVTRFREKPDLETAKEYIASGKFYWNTGMFAWTVEALREAFARYQPAYARGMEVLTEAFGTSRFPETLREVFDGWPSEPIDRVILEKADNRLMIRAAFEWDDIGCWTSLERLTEKGADGNLVSADAITMDTRDCIVFQVPEGSRRPLVATLGVKDLVVVVSDDVVMVCDRSRTQDIKKLVQEVRKKGRQELM